MPRLFSLLSRLFGKQKPSPEKTDKFSPRRSRRSKNVPPDGDTWVELSVKFERSTRLLYYSKLRNVGVFDEPPSGASLIVLQKPLKKKKREKRRRVGVWVEIFVVIGGTRERSLFYSLKNRKGLWDDPPEGRCIVLKRDKQEEDIWDSDGSEPEQAGSV